MSIPHARQVHELTHHNEDSNGEKKNRIVYRAAFANTAYRRQFCLVNWPIGLPGHPGAPDFAIQTWPVKSLEKLRDAFYAPQENQLALEPWSPGMYHPRLPTRCLTGA